MPTCLLIRHGRTSSNANGTLAGWTEGVGLDDVGRGQVTDLAERLRGMPIAAVVSSPLQRCLETAQIVVSALAGVTASVDERLGECHYGAWTGGSLEELAKEPLWRTVQGQPSAARFPDGELFAGESIAQMQARALLAVRDMDTAVLAEHGPTALWALVSHGDVIKSILADAVGAHLDHFQRIVVGPASLSVVSYTDRRPFVVRLNDAGTDLSALVPSIPDHGDAEVGGGAGTAGVRSRDPESGSARSHDAGSAEAGSTDAGSTDAGSTDAGSTDAGSTDAGSTDAGSAGAGSTN